MRVIVVGLGVQGRKRAAVAGKECIATVDPTVPDAAFGDLDEIPVGDYDAALVCTPDGAKRALLEKLLSAGKHVLVEKPLGIGDSASVQALGDLARTHGMVCYTAYNHRFEPHFVRMREEIRSGRLGEIYTLRMFYGNGTARLVRDSDGFADRSGRRPKSSEYGRSSKRGRRTLSARRKPDPPGGEYHRRPRPQANPRRSQE